MLPPNLTKAQAQQIVKDADQVMDTILPNLMARIRRHNDALALMELIAICRRSDYMEAEVERLKALVCEMNKPTQ